MQETQNNGLYDPRFEHDACGVGFVAHIKGVKSHQNVADALTALENMEHRGACGCEVNTGDGAGIMLQVPHKFFFGECLKMGVHLPPVDRYGVGMVFFPTDELLRGESREVFENAAADLGIPILLWRKLPINTDGIGETALSVLPEMEQVFLGCPDEISDPDAFERKLFVLRNYASNLVQNTVRQGEIGFYISSLSHKTIVYKGQLTSLQVRGFFPDLSNRSLVSAFGLVHSRFATNTFPSWRLAHPYRYIAHNGEINTIQGNINWLKTSEKGFTSPYFSKEEMEMLLPIVGAGQSDSASLDNVVELLVLCGRSLPHVLMMLIPEAWDGDPEMDAAKRAFYEFHASFMEPWDGPAAISFTDGNIIGATLDRNGLRPSRFWVTHDDRVIMASEAGVLPIDPALIRESGCLQPGKMFVVDMVKGKLISDTELKKEICSARPYSDWLFKHKIQLENLPAPRVTFSNLEKEQVFKYQKAFGYTSEDLENIIKPMALDGKEAIGSMGIDTPLAILSDQPQHISSYFKQLFAQVTNPPIDPIRERMVMSLSNFVGNIGNLLTENEATCHVLALPHPILTNHELEKIRSIDDGSFQAKTLQMYFRADGKPGSLERAIERICRYAHDAVADGFQVLILSDRAIDSKHAAIPTLLATAAIHHYLIRKGVRGQVGLVVEAGDVWETHHFACLIGFGATAINPYLAFSTIGTLDIGHSMLDGHDRDVQRPMSNVQCQQNYIKSVNDGLLKVFSKMGISTLQSYQGAQIFEIVGIGKKVVDSCFSGAVSRIGGLDFDDLAREALEKHALAFGPKNRMSPVERLPVGGMFQWKKQGEFHLFNPTTIHLLQNSTRTNDFSIFKKYSKAVNELGEKAATLRGLFEMRPTRPAISLDEVEPAENIYRRFATGAMSFGSISWEAHTTLAIAMNILGGKSNTGEGGEDEKRYDEWPEISEKFDSKNAERPSPTTLSPCKGLPKHETENPISRSDRPLQGDKVVDFEISTFEKNINLSSDRFFQNDNEVNFGLSTFFEKKKNQPLRSAIKQVASGRFGVTARYLTEADELQIKMAQGAKPGEGGQLPGHKVDDWIGRVRHATPGVGLISPPPHHDIYSIEDLAQLIFDLKNANRDARISVKLVSKAGVGTIAAGVAKAKADVILVAGHDGGTGASPISSIRHAGLPWEMGLAETHQTLVKNGLRSRVVVQADGQMKTGRDIAIATLLGAEEWGVATAALVVEGCILMRKCHLNTCPVGIATQDPDLRKRFTGAAEHVVIFFKFLTEELREIMAELGFRTIEEMVGQADCLRVRPGISHWKHRKLDLSPILFKTKNTPGNFFCSEKQDHALAEIMDWKLLKLAKPALENCEKVNAAFEIKNTDRTTGTLLSNEITKIWKSEGLPDGTIHFKFRGTAGQSFGAFTAKGLTLELEGGANDYFGKGLSGATLLAYPDRRATFRAEENSIIGNVAFYGATSGTAFVRGKAGERFCVRNSGATVVVEGTGDHACEYMTGGKVLILGETGRNFGAGMSGGITWVFDPKRVFASRCNLESIDLEAPTDDDFSEIFNLLERHFQLTASPVAGFLWKDFENRAGDFVKVFPKEYKKALAKKGIKHSEGVTLSHPLT